MTFVPFERRTINLSDAARTLADRDKSNRYPKEKTMVRKGVWIAVMVAAGIVTAGSFAVRAHAAGDILAAGATAPDFSPVSYTHLDVYKRQGHADHRGAGPLCLHQLLFHL